MIASAVVPSASGRLRFFVAVRNTCAGPESPPSVCLGSDSAQHELAVDEFMAWADLVRPFCFPLGEGITGESKPEPFHFMPFDDSGTHGFCRKLSRVRLLQSAKLFMSETCPCWRNVVAPFA